MSKEISPQAVVSPNAKIGKHCEIYPFAYIEDDVEIGDDCVVFPFVSVLNGTRMGNNNKVHQCTVLGAEPQDFRYTGEKTHLIIGDNNIFRENVVINRSIHASGETVIGDDNFLMEGAHISHDTQVGDHNVFGYGTKIAGDCVIGNGVVFASSVIESAGTHVGDLVMIQAGTTFYKDIPPYIIAGGKPVNYGGTNTMMMERWGISPKVQKHVANAYRLVFHSQNSLYDSITQINEQVPDGKEIQNIINFLSGSDKGIITKI